MIELLGATDMKIISSFIDRAQLILRLLWLATGVNHAQISYTFHLGEEMKIIVSKELIDLFGCLDRWRIATCSIGVCRDIILICLANPIRRTIGIVSSSSCL